MLHLVRARISPLSLRTLALARNIHIKAPGYGSPEAEGPLYTHTAAVVHGIHNPSPETVEASSKKAKKRDPKSKNHKVPGGNNFNELKRMHNEGRD